MTIPYSTLILLGSILSFTSCTSSNEKTDFINLTGNGGVKYWDLIYATTIYDKYQNIHNKLGKPVYCDKFEASGKVTHYYNLDSLEIREMGCDGDVIYNPDDFSLESDSVIRFQGRRHVIDVISKDIMVLKFGPNSGKLATRVYRASKLQNKKLIPCK